MGRKPQPWLYLCACGHKKHYGCARCLACEKHRRQPPLRTCEWCGRDFRRGGGQAPRFRHDVKRFCSKHCSGLHRMAAGQQPIQDPDVQVRAAIGLAVWREQRRAEWALRRQERHERQQQQRAIRQQQRPTCACGAPYTHTRDKRYWCDACFTQEFHAWRHLCPNCGQEFVGIQAKTYCSPRCATQMRHRLERSSCYVAIGHLHVMERNRMAELMALMRAAHRHLQRPVATYLNIQIAR
jgi:hypothetical protein